MDSAKRNDPSAETSHLDKATKDSFDLKRETDTLKRALDDTLDGSTRVSNCDDATHYSKDELSKEEKLHPVAQPQQVMDSSSSISSTSSGFLSYTSPPHSSRKVEQPVEIEILPKSLGPRFSYPGQRLYLQGVHNERRKALEV